MIDLDTLREEISRERERHNERMDTLERKVNKVESIMRGDSEWKQKGFIDQLAELAVFMDSLRGFNFKEMKDFTTEYADFKKRVLWVSGGTGFVAGIVWLIVLNIDKIQRLLTP